MFVHVVLIFYSRSIKEVTCSRAFFFLHVHVTNSAVACGPESMPAIAPGWHAQATKQCMLEAASGKMLKGDGMRVTWGESKRSSGSSCPFRKKYATRGTNSCSKKVDVSNWKIAFYVGENAICKKPSK